MNLIAYSQIEHNPVRTALPQEGELMTLQIRGEFIGGIKATLVCDALRRSGEYPFDQSVIANACKVSAEKAEEIVHWLLEKQYIESNQNSEYILTDPSRAFTRASSMGTFDRTKGDKVLPEFLRRVHTVNADRDLMYFVFTVVVHGSYMRDVERLGDIDIAYELQRRTDEDYVKAAYRRAAAAAKRGLVFSYLDVLTWPTIEIKHQLKARTRQLPLGELEEFIRMQQQAPSPYKVLVGDRQCLESRIAMPTAA